ncbi:MAG: hypothetical protein LBK99_20585 [Opitutaceae bacterium]|jgi:hypothetical protein|nr:hypothetical protein [Opitutaceae bacterium]
MTWPRQTPFTEIAAALKSADWTSQGRATLATRIIPSDTRRPASLVVQAINTTREARAFTWQPGDDNSTGSGNGAGGDAMTTPVTAPPGSVADLVRLPLPERGRLRLSGIAAMLGNSKPDTGERAVRKTISLRNRVLRLQASTKKGIRESGEQMFGASDQIVSGARDGKHFEKSPVSFSARADAEALTLRVNVTKTERGWTQSRLGPSQYLMDSVELFLRTDMASADWSDRDYQRGDIKLSLAQESGGTGRKHVSVDRGREFIDAGKITFSFHDGAGNIAQPGQKGFRCEIRIPWVALKPAPGNGTVVTEAATGGGGEPGGLCWGSISEST